MWGPSDVITRHHNGGITQSMHEYNYHLKKRKQNETQSVTTTLTSVTWLSKLSKLCNLCACSLLCHGKHSYRMFEFVLLDCFQCPTMWKFQRAASLCLYNLECFCRLRPKVFFYLCASTVSS